MKNTVIVVDYQYDFACEKGSLYVKDGEKLQKPIQEFLDKVNGKAFIVASKDWHPANHSSFKEFGGQWPPHCVIGSKGAVLTFDTKNVDLIINKGIDPSKEEYSCVKNDAIKNLFASFDNIFVLGLAKDFCVKNTIRDLNFFNNKSRVYLIEDLSKSVFPNKDKELIKELEGQDVKIINQKEAEEIICK